MTRADHPDEAHPADGNPSNRPIDEEQPTTPPPTSDAYLHDYCPWLYAGAATADERERQRRWQSELATRCDTAFGPDVFVSTLAAVLPERLRMGERSYIAAHVYLTHDVEMGERCTLNPYSVARGHIRMGDDVRVGAHTSLLGFNHSFAPDRPVHRQPTTSAGITIGDDVWIGSHVVVVDGVRIGSHAVIGAGAVVVKDVPDWAVVAGNPARQIRDRRQIPDQQPSRDDHQAPSTASTLDQRLSRFVERAREQVPSLLERCWEEDPDDELGGWFVDRPGAGRTVRAWCDATEITDLLVQQSPPRIGRISREDVVTRLRARQDPETGLLPEYGQDEPPSLDNAAAYHILCVGYALQLLGSSFAYPIQAVASMDPGALVTRLDALSWARQAWRSGSWVDAVATAAYRNLVDFGTRSPVEPLFGWLHTRVDRWHGMWGTPDPSSGRLQIVNGFYRLTRGTYAQFGLPLPYPEQAVDTVLAHTRDDRYFADGRGNACNVLDVIHPLWLAGQQTRHRRAEAETWVRWQLDRALASWNDNAGFSFELVTGEGTGRSPGLQGTEMWLAIIWLLADYLGHSEALDYRPRGVHRPEPGPGLPQATGFPPA